MLKFKSNVKIIDCTKLENPLKLIDIVFFQYAYAVQHIDFRQAIVYLPHKETDLVQIFIFLKDVDVPQRAHQKGRAFVTTNLFH